MRKSLLTAMFPFITLFGFSQTSIYVNPNAKTQTLKGFGVSLSWWAHEFGGWSDSAINDVCTSLTDSNELNFNYFRFNIGGADSPSHHHMRPDATMPGYKPTRTGSYNWSADSNQRKILKKLYSLKSSAIYEAVSYSPPYWMTKSGCSAGNTDGSDNLNDTDYATFADYLTEVVRHYNDSVGVKFSRIAPMNEPFSNWWKAYGSQEGCAFSQAHQQALIDSLYNKLVAKNMLSYCKISAMDANSIDEALNGLNGYISSGVINNVNTITTHSYYGTQRAQLYSAAAGQSKEVWQTESGPLGVYQTGIDNNLVMASRIIDDMKNMGAAAWADWQAMDGSSNWGLWTYDTVQRTYSKSKLYYVRKQFSKYLKPGYTIVYSSQNTIAALNPLNNQLVIVLVNTDTATSGDSFKVDLNLFASAGASASAYRTSPTENCVQLSSISLTNNIFSYTAPGRSVTTFIIPVTLAVDPIGSGNYRITAKHSGKDMSVNGWSLNDGAPIQQWTPLGQGNEVFNVQWTSSGYKLLPSYDAKAVTVNGYSTDNGAVVNQYTDSEQQNQRFSIIDAGGGYYRIVARHSAKCLAVSANGMNDGDTLVQWEWLNYDNFKWQFTSIPLDSTIANGGYLIKAKNSGKAMSVDAWSQNNGGVIEQWDSVCQGNEKFNVRYTSSGYIISPSYNSKVVSVNNYSVANGASIVQWDDLNQQHQRYQIINLGGGYYKIVSRYSNKCLAINGSGTSNGVPVVQWEWLDADNFKWSFGSFGPPCTGLSLPSPAMPANGNANPVLLSENNPDGLKIYPNPSSGYINIQYTGIDNARLQIYDMTGKPVMTRNSINNRLTIYVGSLLSKGTYMLKISGSNKTIVRKIVVQ